jgi:hypothetical protein
VITTFVELPTSFNPADIDIASLRHPPSFTKS